jgi:NIMA (never in mitosis gene a)-related kinase
LGDMNVSKVTHKGFGETQTGTPFYTSPEVWKDEVYNAKSDMWSLGCVLYELITFKTPFKANDMEGLYKKIIRGTYHHIPTTFSTELSLLIKCLLKTNPDQRPSCCKIMTNESLDT